VVPQKRIRKAEEHITKGEFRFLSRRYVRAEKKDAFSEKVSSSPSDQLEVERDRRMETA